MEQCCQYPVPQIKPNHRDFDKLKTVLAEVTESENNSDGFDCNICLDSVRDPVVTFCGHLYCWPCIYKWLQSENSAPLDPDHMSKCPVCKTEVSQNTLIPLYGRCKSGKSSDTKGTQLGPIVPHRPNRKIVVNPLVERPFTSPHSHHARHRHNRDGYPPYQGGHLDNSLDQNSRSPVYGFAGTTTFYPVIDMFGEMIYARFFGNSQTAIYTYPRNTYSVGAGSISNARVRRNVMQAERSLTRVSLFLFCCIILCLLLF